MEVQSEVSLNWRKTGGHEGRLPGGGGGGFSH